MILLVLRPEPGASATVAAARLLGLEPVAAPLFTIRGVTPVLPGEAPDALLLTSANAARALPPLHPGVGRGSTEAPASMQDDAAPKLDRGLRRSTEAAAPWLGPLRHLPVYAVGEATAAAARLAGFPHPIVGEGDAAAIVAVAAAQGVRRLLHLAGREHRAVTHPALTVDRAIVYEANAAGRLPAAAAEALRSGAVALLHSSRAAALFARLVGAAGLPKAAIAALSPAVAAAAGPGWPTVAIAARPTDAALLAAAARLCEEGRAHHAGRS